MWTQVVRLIGAVIEHSRWFFQRPCARVDSFQRTPMLATLLTLVWESFTTYMANAGDKVWRKILKGVAGHGRR